MQAAHIAAVAPAAATQNWRWGAGSVFGLLSRQPERFALAFFLNHFCSWAFAQETCDHRLLLPRQYISNRLGIPLPAASGFFRPTKLWDLLIVNDERLVAALELKSQVGASFGNNFNNRAEEAIGTAVDLWTAFRDKK